MKQSSTEGDITAAGPTVHVQIMFPLKDKKCRVFEGIFLERIDEWTIKES